MASDVIVNAENVITAGHLSHGTITSSLLFVGAPARPNIASAVESTVVADVEKNTVLPQFFPFRVGYNNTSQCDSRPVQLWLCNIMPAGITVKAGHLSSS